MSKQVKISNVTIELNGTTVTMRNDDNEDTFTWDHESVSEAGKTFNACVRAARRIVKA